MNIVKTQRYTFILIRIQPEQFRDRIIFMSMYNGIDWEKSGYEEMCFSNASEVKAYARRFPEGHWSFHGPGIEEKWYGTHTCKPEGQWNLSAEMIDDASSPRKRTSRISSNKSVGPRILEKQERWNVIDSLSR